MHYDVIGDFMNEDNLIKYYNKFNEDKRLDRRHGIVEFTTTMKYIKEYLEKMHNPKIIDIGAGTGKYSVKLADMGYDVTAIELVKHNLRYIEKYDNIKSYQGNAIDLSKFSDNTFDLTLLFGPMYHLINKEEKIKALKEAKRITKDDGIIMVVYCLNDFAILKHGFIDGYINKSLNKIDSNYNIICNNDDLYSYMRIENINELNSIVGLKRVKIISQDGPTDYIRPVINKMSKDDFKLYLDYHLKTCERLDMIGASFHALDVLKK